MLGTHFISQAHVCRTDLRLRRHRRSIYRCVTYLLVLCACFVSSCGADDLPGENGEAVPAGDDLANPSNNTFTTNNETPAGSAIDPGDLTESPSPDNTSPDDLLPNVPPPDDPPPNDPPSTEPCGGGVEIAVVQLVNEQRALYGLGPVSCHLEMGHVARSHAQDMCDRGFFSHTNPDNQDPFDRLADAGIAYVAAGENIAAGQTTALSVMNSWMSSSGHRSNILGNYNQIGMGYVVCPSGYGHYWTQVFRRY